eukprot:jgi/Chrzof1/3557/Cz13g00090.t1
MARFSPAACQAIDEQGRCIITDHGSFVLFNLYGPAVTDASQPRYQVKLDIYAALDIRVRHLLACGRHVIVVGDLNIAPQPIDHCDYWSAPASVQVCAVVGMA